MAKRGFFAELQHMAKVAAREKAKAEREAERARKAAIREAEKARKAEERAAAQLARAQAAEQKRIAKELREAHVAVMEAEVEKKNIELSQVYQEIDDLLAATLDVDDYVDLDSLYTVAKHPPFDRKDLEVPIPTPIPILEPTKPRFVAPPAPKGLRGLFGKKKHERAVAEATAAHDSKIADWRAEIAQIELDQKEAESKHADLEAERLSKLQVERTRYEKECAAREAEVNEHNKDLETLKANLGYGSVEAVQEYVSIVLSNSVYPEFYEIEHDFEFDSESAELRLQVFVPSPDKIPTIKAYKYKKASDEIVSTNLSQKACKDRYAGSVNQVALRSMHEVFEADRRGLIKTISLEVGTLTTNPATGQEGFILFVAVGGERESFLELNLSSVVPAATLSHLGASVSKNPFGLVAADSKGIRRS